MTVDFGVLAPLAGRISTDRRGTAPQITTVVTFQKCAFRAQGVPLGAWDQEREA